MDLPNTSVTDFGRGDTAVSEDQRQGEDPKSRFSWSSSSYGDEDEYGNRVLSEANAGPDQQESVTAADPGLDQPASTTEDGPASNVPGLATEGDVDSSSSSSNSESTLRQALSAKKLKGIGVWGCCGCKNTWGIHDTGNEQHPTDILKCQCGHHSCVHCTLEGLVKKFQPMHEPEVVQLTEDANKEVRFGVYCSNCGIAWRAPKVDAAPKKSVLQKISALPKRFLKHDSHPLEKLRHSRSHTNLPGLDDDTVARPSLSMSVYNLRALSNEMEKGHGKQADFATVQFAGLPCTCGTVTDGSSLCFQLFDPPQDYHEVEFKKLMQDRKVAGFGSTPEDRAKGHGTPTLTIKGIRHPNPLRSAPVCEEDYI